MRYYETMYIVNPSLEEGQLNKIIETLNEEFEKNKVKVINHYVWGKKRLAYPIQDHRYGNYIIIHFESEEQKFLINFGMFLNLNESVMRYQTVRLNKQPDVLELRDIIVKNEMPDSDQATEEQDNNTEESDSDNEVSLEENDQEETEDEDVKSDQPEEKEDKR
jgi:small subunit ribosomal protein S6